MSPRPSDLRFQNGMKKLNKGLRSKFRAEGLWHFRQTLRLAGRWFLCMLLLVSLSSISLAQHRRELETRRKKLLREINLATNLLNTTKKNREATLDRFVTLQQQIRKRKQLIKTLRAEIQFTDASIERSANVAKALAEDVSRLKKEYSAMIRAAYRQKLSQSTLLFIFSASSINEVFRRWQYLKQYNQYRQKQAHLIVETEETLQSKIALLEKRKEQKQTLLISQEKQTKLLNQELEAKEKMLRSLKKDEASLVAELESKEKVHRKLNIAIEKIIHKEMARSKREAEKTNPTALPSIAEAALTTDFSRNKGHLPWPVQRGVITSYFGRQHHPTIKTLQITNNGIDIKTDHNAAVHAVFSGTVVGTQYIPGYEYMVILQHGNYYTVYSNLKEVFVKKGKDVKIRETIGKVSTDRRTNISQLHFEIWRGKTRQNPTAWVIKK